MCGRRVLSGWCVWFAALLLGSLAPPGFSESGPPPVTDDAPAAGKRVRATASGGGTEVYHTLYLPTDWTPGANYPVIIEYAPNPWVPANSGTL